MGGMVGVDDGRELWEKMMDVDTTNTRMESIGGTPIWEFFPSPFHQDVLRGIDRSVRPAERRADCARYTLADAYLRLQDGSLRRPDLMVYCAKPKIVGREPLTEIPGAVIEVLSPGGAMKDLQIGPPSYLANGVLDWSSIRTRPSAPTSGATGAVPSGGGRRSRWRWAAS